MSDHDSEYFEARLFCITNFQRWRQEFENEMVFDLRENLPILFEGVF